MTNKSRASKSRRLSARQRVLKKWPHAAIIRPGEFQNAPDDPLSYVSTRHVKSEVSGLRGGELIGKGESAREAWANAAEHKTVKERRYG